MSNSSQTFPLSNNSESARRDEAENDSRDEVTPTPVVYSNIRIRPMPVESVRRIVAGQAIFDLSSCTKELLDNALDAGAKSINIRLFNKGLDIVEVSDDGCGVPMESRALIATPHATSKIVSFDDIYKTNPHRQQPTYGFRGEALFSLANLSTKLLVATRTEKDDVAQKMEFRRDGTLIADQVVDIPRKIGTTVAVLGLLSAYPVRQRELQRRITQHRAKLVHIVTGYAIFCTGVQLRLLDMICIKKQQQLKEKTLLATNSNSQTLRENVSAILGPSFLDSLCDITVDLTQAVRDKGKTADDQQWTMAGLISKATHRSTSGGNKHTTTTHLFFSINRRPVELPQITRMLKDCQYSYGLVNAVSAVFEFKLPGDAYDVNLSPDKRQVIFTRETAIIQTLQAAVSELWAKQTEGQFQLSDSLRWTDKNILQQETCNEDVDIDEDELDDMGDSSGSRLFDRRYGFVHDPTQSAEKEKLDQQRKIEYLRCPERLQRKRIIHSDVPADPDLESSQSQEHNPGMLDKIDPLDKLNSKERKYNQTLMQTQIPKKLRLQTSYNKIDDAVVEIFENSENKEGAFAATQKNAISTNNIDITVTPSPQSLGCFTARQFIKKQYQSDGTNSPFKGGDNKSSTSLSTGNDRRHWQHIQAKFNQPVSDVEMQGMIDEVYESTSCTTNNASIRGLERCEKYEYRIDFEEHALRNKDNSPQIGENEVENSTDDNSLRRDTSFEGRPARTSKLAGVQSADTPRNEKKLEAIRVATQSTIWNSFGKTKDVCLESMRDRLSQRDLKRKQREILSSRSNEWKDKTAEDLTIAASNITVSLTKEDFKTMVVIGQFNMGFILARSQDGHLWILDQHASDEKFNFEKLFRETVIQEQRLIAPMPLDLSPGEESTVLDNMETFQKNGFRFKYDHDKPPRHRLSLTALPHSGARDGRKAVQYGKEDVSALCAMLGSDDTSNDFLSKGGTGTDGSGLYGNNAVRRYANKGPFGDTAEKVIARLPKSIAMFASRACRSSIMIGTALSDKEMAKVVKRLSSVDHPWNCPHGRPTMRHVGDFVPMLVRDNERAAKYVAGPTITMMTQELVDDAIKDEVNCSN